MHRDFREDNIIETDEGSYTVIDLETVGDAASGELPANWFLDWDEGTLDQGRYTTRSDMYQISKLLRKASMAFSTDLSKDGALHFLQQLSLKQLNAEEALAHPWLL